MRIVDINTSKKYKVYIDKGIRKDIIKYIEPNKYGRYFLLTDKNINNLYGGEFESYLNESGKEVIKFIVPPGETSKSLHMVEEILEFMAENQISRSDVVLGFGGGLVGDLAGFVAGIYQRGMDYIQIPTTVLAAVDSSVGGKTAVNLKAGKNLAGLFNQPSSVICDIDLFKSLSDYDFSCGVAEIIKYAILFDIELFERMKTPLNSESDDLEEIIEKCIKMKRDIVLEDEYDYGKRQLLNLGHTIGHGIERASQFKIGHGQAVAMGIGIIARACGNRGICSMKTAKSIEGVLRANNLPIETDYSPRELVNFSRVDKKSSGDFIRIIIIKDIGKCEIIKVDFNELEKLIELGAVSK